MTTSSNRRAVFLNEMGLGPSWIRRDMGPVVSEPAARDGMEDGISREPSVALETAHSAWETAPDEVLVSGTAPAASEIATMDWDQLKTAVSNCTKCGLCKNRTKAVFGVGDQKAKWLFIGEGPGRNEDLQGEPFVGPAGKLLDNMLLAMGLKRGENVFITNIVKCRPTGPDGRDRPPTPEEAAACMPYLQRQIELIQPAILVALGKTAAVSLLGLDQETAVAQLRGKVYQYARLPLVVTYHPAYLLRKLTDKSKAWSDLCLAMNTYAKSKQQTP